MIYSTPYDLRSVLCVLSPAVCPAPGYAVCSQLCKYGFPIVHSALCHMIYSTPYDLRSVLYAPLPAVVLCFRLCVLLPAVRPAP